MLNMHTLTQLNETITLRWEIIIYERAYTSMYEIDTMYKITEIYIEL